MAYLVQDNFQSYSPGNGYPSGFVNNGTVFQSYFTDASSIAQPPDFDTFWERSGIIYVLQGDIQYPVLADTGSTLSTDTSVFWATLGSGAQFGSPIGMASLYNATPAPALSTEVMTLVLESDASITISAPGAVSVNTLLPFFSANCWTYFQMDVSCSAYLSGGVAYLQLTVSLAVNGNVVISGAVFQTTLAVLGLPTGTAQVSQWGYQGGSSLNKSYFGEFAITNDLQAFPTWPFPGSPINNRISGVNTEVVKIPDTSVRNMRLSGANTEVVKAPSNRNMRLSQLVVEIIISTAGSANYPQYIKPRNRP